MKNFISVDDVADPTGLVRRCIETKKNPHAFAEAGKNKVLGLIFFNSSLRTRMSATRAAYNLGMQVITLNITTDSWQLELEDGVCMDSGKAEHIREAVPVLCAYCDIIGVRSFPGLSDRTEDYAEKTINAFANYGHCPIVNLESATLHPLQSLADMMTIEEYKNRSHPKVVLTWAPHVKALPQSVPNSFLQWANKMELKVTIAHPDGLELAEAFTKGCRVEYNQEEALEGADFVYVKNWSSYRDYGKVVNQPSWEVTLRKLQQTNNAKLMHCLPVRRNLVIADDALDSSHSVVVEQAENRLYTAQTVFMELIKSI